MFLWIDKLIAEQTYNVRVILTSANMHCFIKLSLSHGLKIGVASITTVLTTDYEPSANDS